MAGWEAGGNSMNDLDDTKALQEHFKKIETKAASRRSSISRKTWYCPRCRVRIEEVARGENFSSYMNILWVVAKELRRKQRDLNHENQTISK